MDADDDLFSIDPSRATRGTTYDRVLAELETPAAKLDGGSNADILAYLQSRARAVPITRLYDVTSLDYIGYPVWAAVTPLTNDLMVHSGKGDTPESAKIGAVMEAIERTCGEAVPCTTPVWHGSYRQRDRWGGGRQVIDPKMWDLPFESQYSHSDEISWVSGWDLMSGHEVLVARDLVASIPTDGVAHGVETNGIAAGLTGLAAICHGIYELVERNAVSDYIFNEVIAGEATPEPDSLDVEAVAIDCPPLSRLLELGMEVTIRGCHHPSRVYVYATTLRDQHCPGRPLTTHGDAADFRPFAAITKSVGEAIQAHTMFIAGARDQYDVTNGGQQPRSRAVLTRRVMARWPHRFAKWPPSSDPAAPEGTGELVGLLTEVKRCGGTACIVVNLTRKSLGIPVVRVTVPELAALYGMSTRRPSRRQLQRLVSAPWL